MSQTSRNFLWISFAAFLVLLIAFTTCTLSLPEFQEHLLSPTRYEIKETTSASSEQVVVWVFTNNSNASDIQIRQTEHNQKQLLELRQNIQKIQIARFTQCSVLLFLVFITCNLVVTLRERKRTTPKTTIQAVAILAIACLVAVNVLIGPSIQANFLIQDTLFQLAQLAS